MPLCFTIQRNSPKCEYTYNCSSHTHSPHFMTYNRFQTGAILIAVFHIILCSGIFTWLVKCIATEKSRIELAAEIFLASLCLIAAIILLLGLKLESRRLLTGYVLAQVNFSCKFTGLVFCRQNCTITYSAQCYRTPPHFFRFWETEKFPLEKSLRWVIQCKKSCKCTVN